jgi:anti-sigma-K factor RskA
MNERFDELAPWYVNGSLGAEERAWVENYLVEHPEARAELDWYRSLSKRMQDNAPAVPATIGLARAMTLIRGDRPTLAERFTAFFGTLGMRPATAFAGLAIVAVQGGFILSLLDTTREDAVEIRALKATTTDEGPMLKLNFAPDAKESEIRHLLMSVQGRLAGGPGQLGDYFVVVPKGKEAAIADQLKANPIVQAVTLAPGLPTRE